MTLSNANSLNYLNLYRPHELKFRPFRDGLYDPAAGGHTVANDSLEGKSPIFRGKLTDFSRKPKIDGMSEKSPVFSRKLKFDA